MAGEIPPILVQIQADISQLKTGLAQAESALKGLDSNVAKSNGVFADFGKNLKRLAATIGVTFAATQVVSFFKESVAAAQEAAAVQTRLRTILLNTGAATEAQVEALNAQAQALEKVGVVTKENVTMTQSQLATFDLQSKTIHTLTPAILDYVTAEKGATASTDDFRSMTNGLAQALNGNFASLTRQGFVLTDNQKKLLTTGSESERAAALTEILNSTYKDFNKTLANTPEGRMIKLKNEFGSLKEEIGRGLLPVMEKMMIFISKKIIPALEKLLKFVKDNSTELKIFTTVIGLGTIGWGLYTIAVTRAAIAQKILNIVMALNPIGLIIVAVASLAVGFYKLYNSNVKLKEAVQSFARAVIRHFAALVGAIATMLEAVSKIPGIGKKFEGVAESVRNASNNMKDFAASIGHVDRSAKAGLSHLAELENYKSGGDPFANSKDPKGNALSKADQKKLDKAKEQAKKINKDIAKLYEEAEERRVEALERFNERIADINERFKEQQEDLEERYQERLADLAERFEETKEDLKKRRDKADEAANKRHTETVLKIHSEYNKRLIELEKTKDKKIVDLQEAAQKKNEEITKRGVERLAEIVEKSRERLRNAWQQGTQFSLADLFGMSKEKNINILEALREQLKSIKEFQLGAGELAGAGFSQTFLEEIVKAGPNAGLEMIKQIKKLSPAQQKELQKMYAQLETLNSEGMDIIANTLSTSSTLATKALTKEYSQAQSDITQALEDVNKELLQSISEANAAYSEAFSEAKLIRDEKLLEAQKELNDALAESEKNFLEALEEATNALRKAEADAKKTFDKGLLDAQESLAKAIASAQESYNKSLDEIDKKTQEKVNALLAKLRQAAAIMQSLGATQAASNALASTPSPISTGGAIFPAEMEYRSAPGTSGTSVTVQQNFTSVSADVSTITAATLSAISYGTAMVAI
jgi:chromosome segregation ATPase